MIMRTNANTVFSMAVTITVMPLGCVCFYDHQCTIPNDTNVINYMGAKECYSLNTQKVTVEGVYTCSSNDLYFLVIVAVVMHSMAFSLGVGPVPWTVNAEIYPNWARSVGNSVATTSNWVSKLSVSVFFLYMTPYLILYGTFWLYTVLALCGWAYCPKQRGNLWRN